MSTTGRKGRDFVDSVIPGNLLEEAISWIQANMSPEDVFTDAQLTDWAESNEFVKGGES